MKIITKFIVLVVMPHEAISNANVMIAFGPFDNWDKAKDYAKTYSTYQHLIVEINPA